VLLQVAVIELKTESSFIPEFSILFSVFQILLLLLYLVDLLEYKTGTYLGGTSGPSKGVTLATLSRVRMTLLLPVGLY